MLTMLNRRLRTSSPIGLDLGAGGVRAAQTVRRRDCWTVERVTMYEHPDRNDEPSGSPHPDDVERCMQQAEFRGSVTVAALTAPDVEFHALELPKQVVSQQADTAEQVVKWEVERLTTFRGVDVRARHWLLPAATGSAPNAMGLVSPCDVITRLVDVCSTGRFHCDRVEAAAFAMCRVSAAVLGARKNEVWGVLDLGERQARVAVCVGDVPVLVRSVGTGGREWTDRVAATLNITRRAAEIHKCDHGVALNARRAKEREPTSRIASIIYGAIRGELGALSNEVKRSFEYVLGCYPNRDVTDLVLVGGGARTRNLPDLLENTLGVRVRRISDLLDEPNCRLTLGSISNVTLERTAVAIGLTLESLE